MSFDDVIVPPVRVYVEVATAAFWIVITVGVNDEI